MRLKAFGRSLMLVVAGLLVSTAFAQDAVPNDILSRTLFIKVGNESGTGFLIAYKGKLYLVTAKHVVASLPKVGATIQFRKSGQWVDLKTIRTLFPPSNDVDIAVLETGEDAPSTPYSVPLMTGSDGPTIGQLVWFIGYPFGLGSRTSNAEIPFVKRGTISAIDSTDVNAIVIYIDGFNNPGFSGGPIVYWDFKAHAYRILAVVKGYRNDTASVSVNGQPANIQVLVNSGILVGYSIEHAIQAIDGAEKK
jgi:S1-C subfamily serine protease